MQEKQAAPDLGPWAGIGRRAYNRVSDSYNTEPKPAREPRIKGESKAQTLRHLLQTHGRLTARQLATMADLEASALVGALLKNDVGLGRVKFDGVAYCWHDQFDEKLRASIAEAITLLRRHGYKVEKP